MRILLVEDEQQLAHWLNRALTRHADMVVEWADDGLLADRRLQVEEFDAVVLDLGIPGMDGRTVLKRLRERDDRTPVLILTARDSLGERLDTLYGGADDFMPKPFVVEELEARLMALIRRSRGRDYPRFSCGPLVFDSGSQRFMLHGEMLTLPPREYGVLRALIQRSSQPVGKQWIIERAFEGESEVGVEVIEVLVHRLRKRLADSGVHIATLRGMGYCLESDAADPHPGAA